MLVDEKGIWQLWEFNDGWVVCCSLCDFPAAGGKTREIINLIWSHIHEDAESCIKCSAEPLLN